MPRRESTRSRSRAIRVTMLSAAGVLGLAAVLLVVLGTSQKQLQVGVLLGLWGILIAAWFGTKRGGYDPQQQLADAEQRAAQLHDAQLEVARLQREALEAAQQTHSKQEIELRRFGELQLAREAAARREADLQLELSLRREIERMMTEHLGSLREEVSALRAEVVDKLGGELRLERIETTRLIGSDLEALQHEIRRLAGSQESIAAPPPAVTRFAAGPARPSAPVRRTEDHSDIVDAELVESAEMPIVRPPAPAAKPEPTKPEPTKPEPTKPEPTKPEPTKPEPTKPEPTKPEPTKPEATKPEPTKPVDVTTRSAEPAKPQVARTAPPKADPAEVQPPVPAEAVAPEPVRPPAETVQIETTPTETPVTSVRSEPWSAATVVQPEKDVTQTAPAGDQSGRVPFSASHDPFADLPRLSPLPDDVELIHDPEPTEAESAHSAGRRRAPDAETPAEPVRYTGRRRADGELETTEDRARADAHAKADEPDTDEPDADENDTAGRRRAEAAGRRRAPDDAPDDLMARLHGR